MGKSADDTASSATFSFAGYVSGKLPGVPETAAMAEIGTAVAKLRHDLDACHPNNPSLAYALAAETHAAMQHKWHHYPQETRAALLLAFLKEVSGVQHQLRTRIARIEPENGYMFGLQDEAMKLEAQAEILQEEINRAEADLQTLLAGDEALQ